MISQITCTVMHTQGDNTEDISTAWAERSWGKPSVHASMAAVKVNTVLGRIKKTFTYYVDMEISLGVLREFSSSPPGICSVSLVFVYQGRH